MRGSFGSASVDRSHLGPAKTAPAEFHEPRPAAAVVAQPLLSRRAYASYDCEIVSGRRRCQGRTARSEKANGYRRPRLALALQIVFGPVDGRHPAVASALADELSAGDRGSAGPPPSASTQGVVGASSQTSSSTTVRITAPPPRRRTSSSLPSHTCSGVQVSDGLDPPPDSHGMLPPCLPEFWQGGSSAQTVIEVLYVRTVRGFQQ